MNSVATKNQSIINLIAHSIENDEQGIKNILQRNGIDTSVIKTKSTLRSAFISSLGKSKVVALDFNRYIDGKKNQSSSLNATGDIFDTNIDPDGFNSTSSFDNPFQTGTSGFGTDFGTGFGAEQSNGNTATLPINSDSDNGGFFSGLNLKDLLNTGVNILEIQRDIKTSNDNKEAIENAVKIKQNEINLQPNKSNSSIGVYIAIGLIGLTLVGGIIYVATKKK